MGSRTRDKLIEVAKSLFVRNGVENTTISDIANASDKGRRTIYTYFKNKKEIYTAVIERESDNMVKALRDIADSDAAPVDKLRGFFETRLTKTKHSSALLSLQSLLRFDFGKNEMVRKKANEKEVKILHRILDEGVAFGDFDSDRCALMRKFILRLLNSIDELSINEDFDTEDAFISYLVEGVRKPSPQPPKGGAME